MSKKISSILVILIVAVTVVGSVVWVYETPWAYDDWYYRLVYSPSADASTGDWAGTYPEIDSMSLAWESVVNHCSNNGRLTNILHILFQPYGHATEALFLGICMVGMFAALCLWARVRRRVTAVSAALAAIVMWTVFPWFDQFQSLAFIFGYVPPSIALLVLLYVVYNADFNTSVRRKVVTILLAFFAAWLNEGNAVGLVVYFAAVLLFYRSKCRISSVAIPLVGVLVGLAVNLLTGTAGRMSRAVALTPLSMQFLVQYLMQLWPLALSAVVLTVSNFRGDRRRGVGLLPFFAAACVSALMPLWLGYVGRVLWTSDLFSAVIILSCLSDYAGRVDARVNCGIVSIFAVLYALWMYNLCSWEAKVGDESRSALAAHVSPAGAEDVTAVYCGHVVDDDIPYWLMQIVHNPLEHIWGAYAIGHYLQGYPAAVLVLPDSLEGKPFESWHKVPGNNHLRGVWPMVAAADSIPADVAVKVGAPGSNMALTDRLLVLLKERTLSSRSEIQGFTSILPVRLPDGSTVYRYIPESLPRTISRRPVLAVDTVRPRMRPMQ